MVGTFLHLFIESPSKSHFLVMLYAYKCCKNELLKLPPAFNSIMLKIYCDFRYLKFAFLKSASLVIQFQWMDTPFLIK